MGREMSGTLVLLPSVHAIDEGRTLRMDDKFVDGLTMYARNWHGGLRLVIRRGSGALPFARSIRPEDLPCELVLLDDREPVTAAHLSGAAIALGTADDTRQLDLLATCRAVGVRLVYTIEYDFRTRLAIARLELRRNPLRLLRSWQWLTVQERRRRRALAAADGIQANGFPAAAAYGPLTDSLCMFLDGRMRRDDMADAADMTARRTRLMSGAPLRLVHAGRLEAMKGAGDLVPFMRALRDARVNARLDVIGTGALLGKVVRDAADLGDMIRLHPPMDFQTELVPWLRLHADMFIATHRQSDPSCSYLEAMGCGLPVLGTDNGMLTPLIAQSGGGWVTAMGRPRAQAAQLARLDRGEIAAAGARALEFARQHDFQTEFRRRLDHLRTVLAG